MHASPVRKSAEAPVEENALRALVRAFGVVDRVMQPYFARYGISGAQWSVLRQLDRAEGEGFSSLRMTELSKRLLIRLPSATGVVDRLVRDGLVSRVALPEDLRVKLIRLTEAGRQRVRDVLKVHGHQIESLLAGLSVLEQTELQRLLTQMRTHLETQLEAKDSAHRV